MTQEPIIQTSRKRPQLGPSEAARIALEYFGVSGRAREVPSYEDRNFVVEEATNAMILKVSASDESDSVLDLQETVLNRLNEQEPHLPTPSIVATTNGESRARITLQDGCEHWVRGLTYLSGTPLAAVRPRSVGLLSELGGILARLDRALFGIDHDGAVRPDFDWDLANAATVIGRDIGRIRDTSRRALVERALAEFEADVIPRSGELRTSLIHNDANDHNVLVSAPELDGRHISGLIDFGDSLETWTVAEIAIAAAYGCLGSEDPLRMIASIVTGYSEVLPLSEAEAECVIPLIQARLGVSVCRAARALDRDPEHAYLQVSNAPAWDALRILSEASRPLSRALVRDACGLAASRNHAVVTDWLTDSEGAPGPVLDLPVTNESALVFDLSVESALTDDLDALDDTAAWTKRLVRLLEDADKSVGIGRYGEVRLCYQGDRFLEAGEVAPERRTIHLGVDLFVPAGTGVCAPLGGTIRAVHDHKVRLDYGPTVILEHNPVPGVVFLTLYGHLSRESIETLEVGQSVARGEVFSRIGDFPENGDWPPHLHFQVMTDALDPEENYPGVAAPSRRSAWMGLVPDPGMVASLPEGYRAPDPVAQSSLLAKRSEILSPSLSVSYRDPIHVVRGWNQFLYDAAGQPYLDCVNNVCHVGHSHPAVVRAASDQATVLNTNTRYLHETVLEYAYALASTLPDPLEVCFFVNSGSEANELALRLARTATGREAVVALEGAYHGNTGATLAVSSYKFDGPGGSGAPPGVYPALMPDDYRGPHRRDDPDRAARYAEYVASAFVQADADGRPAAAFIAESILSCGGQIELPQGYLELAYAAARSTGAVCIADEVQVGFGRVGTHFWGFETQGVIPDIVTLGKPIGNGHPLGAVVTTRAIAEAFANGMEYFNTFGGNPASCAAGLAVLRVLQEQDLQAHALAVGGLLRSGLERLSQAHPSMGDVRGRGLFVGVEFVSDREARTPAPEVAEYVVERMKDHRILLSVDGPVHNVIKIKPPMVFDEPDAHRLVQALGSVLLEDFVTRHEAAALC